MALSENDVNGVKQVPWFSLAEWHDVYKQIYSNETSEQAKAYETLLAWKARMPKLPVGVDSTLSILQVCLRDREWMSKIDSGELPMYYEKDLSLMYSTTIMRFLNHISAIGQTKQTSLFQIAKQLKIPEWIVDLRHDAAHGHELAPLEVLRMAINILLEWLHEEYWAAEAHMMEEHYMKEADKLEEEEESEETQALTDLVELWTSVGLYIHAGHRLVLDIPDPQLRRTLKDLRTYALSQQNRKTLDVDEHAQVNTSTVKTGKEYNLTAAQALLLTEISMYLTKSESIFKKDNAICNVLCKNEAFLSNSDIMRIFMPKGENKESSNKNLLPRDILWFWKDIIVLLHKKKMLGTLIFKLLNTVDEERENKERRRLAALWINSIIYSFVQLDIAQSICRTMKYKSKRDTKLSTKDLSRQIKEHIHLSHPYLKNVLWLDISSIIPRFLLDVNFLSKLLLQVNEFSAGLVQPILELATSRLDVQMRKHLCNLLKIYMFQKHNNDDNEVVNEKIFTVEDLYASSTENDTRIQEKKRTKKNVYSLADQAIRNLQWKPALDTYQWVGCPIGVLPWQNSLKSLEPLKLTSSKYTVSTLDSQITAGIVNSKNLKMKSRINWDNVLQGKRRVKRKYNEDVAVTIMNRALEIAKRQK